MCLRNFQNNLVHGALIEAEILTSPSPCICSPWPSFWALALCPQVCQHLPSDLKMFLCVSGTSKKHLVYGALIEAKILTSSTPCICSTWPGFWVLALCPQVLALCPPPNLSRNVSMCLKNLHKIFGAWGPNRS